MRVRGPRSEGGRKRVPRGSPSDRGDVAARIRHARAEHEPDRPGAEDGDEVARAELGPLDRVEAAGERVDERRDGRIEPPRDGVEVDLRDPGRDEHALGEGPDQPLGPSAENLPIGQAGRAVSARRRRRGDDAPAVARVDARELAAERRRGPVQRVAPGRKRVPLGAACQGGLDLDDDVAFAGLGRRHLVDAEISRRVDA